MRDLIFRMVAENPTWGAPRIHGELLKLGFDIAERTVSRWIQRASKNPDPARLCRRSAKRNEASSSRLEKWPQMAPDPNPKRLQVLEKMVGAIGFEPMTSTV